MICFELRIICTYHRLQKIWFELQILCIYFKSFYKVTYELLFGIVYSMVDLKFVTMERFLRPYSMINDIESLITIIIDLDTIDYNI